MNFKKLAFAAAITVSAATLNANAQKVYKEGSLVVTTTTPMGQIDSKVYFKNDTTGVTLQQGPANIKVIGVSDTYFAVLVDVPVAGKKLAAVATPAEIEETMSQLPELTFTPTTETKQISGFNCTKVTAKNTKTNDTFDIWVTNDISLPQHGSAADIYAKAGGVPIDYYSFQQGKAHVVVKSISDEKVPAGMFKITDDYQRISLTDLKAMSGRR
ncbi:uncharacterized protein DUF4412 [Mucilaginibacter yixingensis]|uniref:Uncharacterized protein DUF4412 n=1 Tax=Mucilaginibacter yixingensis TaxID=1295612 RepID=A0A2T5JEW4_9SPHI|nr:DUF4412 domain-containing protein [Mucilaginibacter yixingensis]PTR00973.1 uncharacterized protein DUF4412 [Mucilaginibacter yixingensis]